MRGLAFGLLVSAVLFWVPLAVWIVRDFGSALAWWAGVATVLASWASAEVINRQKGNNRE